MAERELGGRRRAGRPAAQGRGLQGDCFPARVRLPPLWPSDALGCLMREQSTPASL